MIGTALIEECIKNEVEVYAVVRASSPKKNRLREHRLIHQVDASLEELEDLPDKISKPCDTFYHIAWGNTGENRNSSTELQSRNIAYTLAAVPALQRLWDADVLSEQAPRQSMAPWMQIGFRRTARCVQPRLTERLNFPQGFCQKCFAESLVWNGSGPGFSAYMGSMKKKPQ